MLRRMNPELGLSRRGKAMYCVRTHLDQNCQHGLVSAEGGLAPKARNHRPNVPQSPQLRAGAFMNPK
jgi:hypothetical protein